MKKATERISIVLAICLVLSCLCSCSPEEFKTAGNIALRFSSNIIGAEKGFEVETEILKEAAGELVNMIAPKSGTGGIPTSSSDIVSIVDSINSFSGRVEPIETTTTDAGFTYKKTVNLAEVSVQDDDKNTISTSIGDALEGKPKSAVVHEDIDMSKYCVKEVIDIAVDLVWKFGEMKEYKDDEAVQNLVKLANECIDGCSKAVDRAISDAKGGKINLEDVVLTSLANVVKTEYGKYAVDKTYTGSEILKVIPGALDYLNALMNMGIIPVFNVSKLLSDFQDRLVN